ncbi:DUF7716 domain-containing protein [Thorsellia kenyensis]|uniref:DUF7716 domain-containing protein n=1 Tax=Thorsellia kenyensis TaxID=1549888 RepID=A0ABV6C6E3_9GAMM
MKKLEFQREYTLSELINDIVKKGYKSNNFCLYTKGYVSLATENLICYLECYPTINDDDEEEYPKFVIKQNLELFYYGEQFEDVLTNVLHQKNTASIEDFITSLNYYLNNDAFLTL